MSRLVATIACDVRLQWRNGMYLASVLIAVTMAGLLRWLPETAADWLFPLLIAQNVVVNTFYFVAGLLLLERAERTLAARFVTSLRAGEYLASKVITLTGLSLLETLVIVVLAGRLDATLLLLAAGVVLLAAPLCLFGVAFVARYDSVNEFLMPSVLYSAVLSLPLLGYVGIGPRLAFIWHPMQGALDLMGERAASGPGSFVYAVAVPLLWVAPAYLAGRRALRTATLVQS